MSESVSVLSIAGSQIRRGKDEPSVSVRSDRISPTRIGAVSRSGGRSPAVFAEGKGEATAEQKAQAKAALEAKVARIQGSEITQAGARGRCGRQQLHEAACEGRGERDQHQGDRSSRPGPWRHSRLLRVHTELGVHPDHPQVRRHVPGVRAVGREQPRPIPVRSPSPTPSRIRAATTTRSSCRAVHSEAPHRTCRPPRLRGYVQTNNGTDSPGQQHHRAGPDHATLGRRSSPPEDRPVRIKFTNELPTERGGRPLHPGGRAPSWAPARARSAPRPRSTTREPRVTPPARRHTPWISDGTPHQWITPAGENTSYPKGVSVQNVPDMPDPGDGLADLLLLQRAKRPPALLPRPLLGHHAPQRVRGRGGRLPDPRRDREGPHRPRHHPPRRRARSR